MALHEDISGDRDRLRSGRRALARELADKGWTVALIEREHLGGSCSIYGCTRTRTMLASAQIAHYARRADDFGVWVGSVGVDRAAVVSRQPRNQ